MINHPTHTPDSLWIIDRFITCRAPFTHPVFASLDHPLSSLR